MKNKLRKILSIIVCCALLLSIASVTAFAGGDEDILILSADATIPEPALGYHPTFGELDVPEYANYTASVYSWYTTIGGEVVHLTESDVFKPDLRYNVRVEFTPDSGFAFDRQNGVFTLNGKQADNVGGTIFVLETRFDPLHKYSSEWKMNNKYHWKECDCGKKADKEAHKYSGGKCTVCEFEKPEVIPELDLTAFKLPVAGDSVKDEAFTNVALPEGAKYSVSGITWLIYDGGKDPKPVEDNFEEGHTYVASIELELNSIYYMFADIDTIDVKYSVPDKNFYGVYVNENCDYASVNFLFTLIPSDAKFITELTVTGVTPPVAGETPTVEGISLGENVEIDTETLFWIVWDEEKGYFTDEFDTDVFEEGKKYAVQIVAYPINGYYFADNMTVSINGKDIPDVDVSNPAAITKSVKMVTETQLYMGIVDEDMVIFSDTETDTSTNTETETDTGTNTESETDTSTNTESETDTSTNTETETDTNTDTSTDTGTDTETDTDVKTVVSGDINCDGKINMEDVTSLQKIIAKLIDFEKYGETSKANADCNHDGKVNMEDVVQIQKYLAKLIPSL